MKAIQLSCLLIPLFWFVSCSKEPAKSNASLLDIMDEKKQTSTVQKNTQTSASKHTGFVHYGIDVSHFQGDIIEKLDQKDSLRFAICKATQGQYFVDPEFHFNWNEIKERGLVRGTYHFYDCSVDPEIQAAHFYATVGNIEATDIAPVLDIEQGSMTSSVSGSQMVSDILVFLKSIHEKFGRKPILYTDYAFAQEYFKDDALAEYDLWLAEYENTEEPNVPDLWKSKGFFIWQKSSNYHMNTTILDYDEFQGNLSNIVK
tara:strand:- start:285 stop:1061 length:777 start_codon:yes stop_codon:yes gene_type:complete